MKKYLFKTIQTLLVFSLAFTLTNCGNLDNPLEELSGGSGDGGGSSSGEEDIPEVIAKYEFSVTDLSGVNDLTANITSFELTDGEGIVIATAELSEGKYTVEKSKLASATIVWVKAVTGTGDAAKTYIQKLEATDLTTLETEKKLKMATIGDWILGDGTFAVKGTTGAEAVIAYVGKVDKYFDKFLALALEDADANTHKWADALSKVNTFAAAHPITIGGTPYNTSTTGDTYYDKVAANENTSSATAATQQTGWRMPSVTDWRYIFDGIAGIAGLNLSDGTIPVSATSPAGVKDGMVYRDGSNGSSLRDAINTACGNTELKSSEYGISSEYSDNSDCAWFYNFQDGTFVWIDKIYSIRVRAVFAY